MPLTLEQKDFLVTKRDDINAVFNKYKTDKVYMGLYINFKNGRPYISFSNIDSFKPVVKMAGNINSYCCTYVCADDFDSQTVAFLTL